MPGGESGPSYTGKSCGGIGVTPGGTLRPCPPVDAPRGFSKFWNMEVILSLSVCPYSGDNVRLVRASASCASVDPLGGPPTNDLTSCSNGVKRSRLIWIRLPDVPFTFPSISTSNGMSLHWEGEGKVVIGSANTNASNKLLSRDACVLKVKP